MTKEMLLMGFLLVILLIIYTLKNSSDEEEEDPFVTPEKKQSYEDDFGDVTDTLHEDNLGIYINGGKITRDLSFRHTCLIAPSGGGKTSSILIPTALTLDNCSIVFLDPAKELFQKTSGYLAEQDYQIRILDFMNPNWSIGFNPLASANTTTELRLLADILFASAKRTTKEGFWVERASKLATVIFKLLKKYPVEFQNLANAAYLIDCLQGDTEKVNLLFIQTEDKALIQEYKSLVKVDIKVFSSIVSTCQSSLSIFSDDAVARTTSTNTLSFEQFRQRKVALFIQIGIMDAEYLSFLAEVYFTQFFRYCMSYLPDPEYDQDIFILADEAGSLSIKGFPEALANLRKYRVSVTYAIQNKSQLISRYGKEGAETILANSYNTLAFAGMEYSLAKEIEQRLGKWTFTKEDGKQGQREIMTASELMTLHKGGAVYLQGSTRPAVIPLLPYYKDDELLYRSEIQPPEIYGSASKNVSYIELPKVPKKPRNHEN